MRVTYRPTTREDLAAFASRYGLEQLPHRTRCISATIEDRCIGLGGLIFFPDGVVAAFAFITDELRKYPAAIHRGGLAVMRDAQARGIKRVLAEVEPGRSAAARWLERLGFAPVGNVYVWEADSCS